MLLISMTGILKLRRESSPASAERITGFGAVEHKVGNSTGEYEDASNTDSIAAGNSVNFQIVTGNGTGTGADCDRLSVQTTSTARQSAAWINAGFANVTRYLPIEGSGSAATTEAPTQTTVRVAQTARRLFVRAPT